jgi:[acyl-carrier-protein] S-malonyltransferase
MVARARDRLRKSLAEATFAEADPVVVANVDARHHADPSDWPGLLSAQLCAPVRWSSSVRTLFNEGVRTFVEFGPGETLALATRQCFAAKAVQSHAISTPQDLEALVDRLIATPSMRRKAVADHDQLAGRLVVSPAAGPFQPVDEVAHAAPRLAGIPSDAPTTSMRVAVGDLIGWVGDAEVRSAFAGTLGGLLVISGERVMPSQPVAWLDARAESSP